MPGHPITSLTQREEELDAIEQQLTGTAGSTAGNNITQQQFEALEGQRNYILNAPINPYDPTTPQPGDTGYSSPVIPPPGPRAESGPEFAQANPHSSVTQPVGQSGSFRTPPSSNQFPPRSADPTHVNTTVPSAGQPTSFEPSIPQQERIDHSWEPRSNFGADDPNLNQTVQQEEAHIRRLEGEILKPTNDPFVNRYTQRQSETAFRGVRWGEVSGFRGVPPINVNYWNPSGPQYLPGSSAEEFRGAGRPESGPITVRLGGRGEMRWRRTSGIPSYRPPANPFATGPGTSASPEWWNYLNNVTMPYQALGGGEAGARRAGFERNFRSTNAELMRRWNTTISGNYPANTTTVPNLTFTQRRELAMQVYQARREWVARQPAGSYARSYGHTQMILAAGAAYELMDPLGRTLRAGELTRTLR